MTNKALDNMYRVLLCLLKQTFTDQLLILLNLMYIYQCQDSDHAVFLTKKRAVFSLCILYTHCSGSVIHIFKCYIFRKDVSKSTVSLLQIYLTGCYCFLFINIFIITLYVKQIIKRKKKGRFSEKINFRTQLKKHLQ